MQGGSVRPAVVDWSGENPGMYLKETASGPFVTLISFFASLPHRTDAVMPRS